jgi:capsular polysaccharide biosynthesis protein
MTGTKLPGTLIGLTPLGGDVDFGRGPAEEPLDAGRYVEALRRHAALLIALPLAVAAIVLVIALALPNSYTATAKIAATAQAVSNSNSGSSSANAGTPPDLATTQAYITSPPVLTAAAGQLRPDSVVSLQSKVTTSVDSKANIIDVIATDGDPIRAARIANTVSQTFLNVRAASERTQLAAQEAALGGKLQAARVQGSAGLASALEQQISSLAAQEASAGSDLQLLASARVPTGASSPRPARDALVALVAVLFLTVLVIGGKELLSPSVASGRELSALIGSPVLARVPLLSSPTNDGDPATPAAAEAYRFLAKSLELVDWPRRPRLIAITSADHGEGTTTTVSWLGAALANAGASTLLISPDLGEPNVPQGLRLRRPGALGTEVRPVGIQMAKGSAMPFTRVAPNLSVLAAGALPPNANDGIVRSFFERVRGLDFDYVLFDLAPLNRAADTQLFVRHADATVVACFVRRTTAEQLRQARELLDRLHVVPAGTVMLGVRGHADSRPRPAAALSWIRGR